jgi:hypothetical protein
MKKTKPKEKKLRTYLVPVVVTYEFGDEVEVEATSMREARKLARNNEGHSEGLDWDRADLIRTKIGKWQKVEEIKS